MTLIEEFQSGTPLIFTGRVQPERATVEVYFGQEIDLHVQLGGDSIGLGVSLSIAASQVSVVARLMEGEAPDLFTLRNTVEDFVRTTTDALGYVTGRGYEVEISAVASGSGHHVVFGVEVGVLADSFSERPLDPAEVALLALSEPHLSRSLEELRKAIRAPARTAAHCFAAIEAIRQYFVEKLTLSREDSWQHLRNTLKIDRAYLNPLSESSKPQRHAQLTFASDQQRGDELLRAWRVVDRFCIYLHDGKVTKEPLGEPT